MDQPIMHHMNSKNIYGAAYMESEILFRVDCDDKELSGRLMMQLMFYHLAKSELLTPEKKMKVFKNMCQKINSTETY